MINDKSLAVVVPACNEETQIAHVLATMPAMVDTIIVVDDHSTDATVDVVVEKARSDPRIHLIRHDTNQGVGGAIVSGYMHARELGIDVTAVMAGDGQMAPEDLPAIAGPVARGEVDYAKANRLFNGTVFHYSKTPVIRYLGNSLLSLLTKIASGYWHVADSQTGFTAINLRMLRLIEWEKTYKRYGCPNDYLVRLNMVNARVRDVPLEPRYNVGERSKMKLTTVVPTITLLLARLFVYRMFHKYVIRDSHPLVLFYAAGFATFTASAILFVRLSVLWYLNGRIPPMNALAWGISLVSSLQFLLFAMFFDMEANKDLR